MTTPTLPTDTSPTPTVCDRLRDRGHVLEMTSLIVTSTAMIASKLVEAGYSLTEVDPISKRRVVAIESTRLMEDILTELGIFDCDVVGADSESSDR